MTTNRQDADAAAQRERIGLAQLAALVHDKAAAVAGKLPLLGPVAWLLSQQPSTRHVPVGELVERVMPALALDQAKLYLRGGLPMAFVSWARLSDEAALRFRRTPHRLSPEDWRSGEQIWLIDVVAPFDGPTAVLQNWRTQVFQGQTVNALGALNDGIAEVVELGTGNTARPD